MGKGRAPCCDKTKVKRGPWSQDEDLKLITFIHKNGHENWRSLPKQAGLLRCGKSCRLRWINYLRPDVKRGNFTAEEEETIIRLHQSFGNKWSKIASKLNADEAASKGSSNEEETSREESSPNASMSFGGSNVTSKEEEEDDAEIFQTFEEYMQAYSGFTGVLDEVDKPELLEIPFDLDPDIWSFIDEDGSSDSFQQPGKRTRVRRKRSRTHRLIIIIITVGEFQAPGENSQKVSIFQLIVHDFTGLSL